MRYKVYKEYKVASWETAERKVEVSRTGLSPRWRVRSLTIDPVDHFTCGSNDCSFVWL
jgi:hypothetical protein